MGVQKFQDSHSLTAEHYRRHRQQLAEKGTIKKHHAISTKNNIRGIKKRWKKFCELMNEDPLAFLQHCSKEDIMTFWKWILDQYKVRKKSTLHEYWRVWRMLYRRCVGRSLHAKIAADINDYIDEDLRQSYNLDLTTREKPVMNVDDVFLILHHHWVMDTATFPDGRQRLQVPFLILTSAYTATRPGALVYVPKNEKKDKGYCIGEDDEDEEEEEEEEEDDTMDCDWDSEQAKTLCYGDVTLFLLPNPDGIRDLLAMEIDVKHAKGHQRKPKRKIFVFSEVENLIFDPVLLMIVLALDDDAFESNIRSVRDIFRAKVRPPRRSLQLRWKSSILQTPIFRQAVPTTNGVQTSSSKALRYHMYLYYLQRLGLATGFMQILGPYDIRRGVGNKVDEVATPAVLQQVMNHRDAGIFQAYLNERVRCDVQAAFLGRPSADALIKAASHMSRYVDPRAPTELSVSNLDALKTHPDIVRARQLRDGLSKDIRAEFGTIQNSKGTKLYEMYQKAEAGLRRQKTRLRKSAFQESRKQFFEKIETQDINKQLDLSLLDLDKNGWTPEMVEHDLEERRYIARMLCSEPSDLTEEASLDRRICTIEAMVAFCRVRETPRQKRSKPCRDWGILEETVEKVQQADIEPPSSQFPMICTSTQCLFCLGNAGLPYESRTFCFSRPRKAREHVERQHLRFLASNEPIPCPHPQCGEALQDIMHFKNHAATVHNCFLFARSGLD